MRQRKLQVFLSSTYTDLIDERLAAMEAILAAGHIPAAMEQFTPGDEDAWTIIKRWIDESDAYILILGGRYGSIEPETGKSYVELEYEYALSQNKPFMSIVITDAANEARIKEKGWSVDEREHQAELKVFRELVTKKHCAFWNDVKDIKTSIFQKILGWQARPELEGWVRAEEAASPKTLNELARLSKENSDLRERLSTATVEFHGLRFEDFIKILREDERNLLVDRPEISEEMLNDFQAKFPHLYPRNVGHLFELTMKELSQAEAPSIATVIPSIDESKKFECNYRLYPLIEHGLSEKQVRQGFNDITYYIYALTEVGMRFKNKLLAYGTFETRLTELWDVPIVGSALE